jgi:hypothetical protein
MGTLKSMPSTNIFIPIVIILSIERSGSELAAYNYSNQATT